MARRATFFNTVWDEGVETLTLDAGDLFGKRTRQERNQTEFLCEQTGAFGYDGIGLGEQDLNYGLGFLKQMIEKYKLPFTSANVHDPGSGELILPEYLVVEKNGIRFGIVSILDPQQKIITMDASEAQFRVDDPIAALRDVIPKLREKCDTVVLLSHMGDNGTENILKEVKGIDVVVVGHTFRSYETERIVQDAVMLAAVYEGRFIGRADLQVEPSDGKVMAVQVHVTSLDDQIADDKDMAGKVTAFKEHEEQAKAEERAKWPRDKGSKDEQFLGLVNCRSCHTDAYESWRKTEHAQAFNTLRGQALETEPQCLTCHTTGYQYYGGYEENGPNKHLTNVQCESCHGYGTEHERDASWLKVARESCSGCHDNSKRPCYDKTKDTDFDYASYWEKIKH